MLASMWEEAGGAWKEELMLLKGEWRWETADNACREQGGHLASINTLEKQKSALRLLKKVQDSGEWLSYIWLGGSDSQEEGNWSWSDKSLWDFDNWYPGNSRYLKSPEPSNGSRENCLKMKTQDGIWWDEDCNKRFRALCHRDTHVFKGKLNRTWTILSTAVPQEMEFVWESDLEFAPSKRTGLSISWRFEEELNLAPDPVYAAENQFLIGTINLIHDLKEKGASETEIWTEAIAYKMSVIENRYFEGRCEKSLLKQPYQRNLVDTFSRETTRIGSITYEPSFTNEISDEDLAFGFKIYFFLTFCHENFLILWKNFDDNMELAVESEALNLYIFYSDTIDMMSPQNILQTFVNMMSSKEVMFDENLSGIRMMLEELTDVLSPSFPQILAHLYTESELDKLSNFTHMTFLKTQSSESAISPGEKNCIVSDNNGKLLEIFLFR